jgi:hypothetical protein
MASASIADRSNADQSQPFGFRSLTAVSRIAFEEIAIRIPLSPGERPFVNQSTVRSRRIDGRVGGTTDERKTAVDLRLSKSESRRALHSLVSISRTHSDRCGTQTCCLQPRASLADRTRQSGVAKAREMMRRRILAATLIAVAARQPAVGERTLRDQAIRIRHETHFGRRRRLGQGYARHRFLDCRNRRLLLRRAVGPRGTLPRSGFGNPRRHDRRVPPAPHGRHRTEVDGNARAALGPRARAAARQTRRQRGRKGRTSGFSACGSTRIQA